MNTTGLTGFEPPGLFERHALQNRGTTSLSFTNELDALKWLDARQPATRTPGPGDRPHPEK